MSQSQRANSNNPSVDTLFRDGLAMRRHFMRALHQSGELSLPHIQPLLGDYLQDPNFKDEFLSFQMALKTGQINKRPDLSTPKKQFLWGLFLSLVDADPDLMNTWPRPNHLSDDQKPAIHDFPVWNQLKSSLRAKKELYTTISNAEVLARKALKIRWGAPGQGTHYMPSKSLVVVDMMEALSTGFVHYRAATMEAVSKGILTKEYPDHMTRLRQQIMRIKQKQATLKKAKKSLPRQDYKALRRLELEWRLYSLFFDAANGNAMKQNSTELSDSTFQDFGFSFNHAATTLDGVRPTTEDEKQQLLARDIKDETALEKYFTMLRFMKLSFYQRNGLFEDTLDGWHHIGLKPENIRRRKKIGEPRPHANDYARLQETLRNTQSGLQYTIPEADTALRGMDYFNAHVMRTNRARNQIIADLWDNYARQLVQKIIQEQMQKLDEQMDQQAQENQDADGQDGDGQEGQDGESNDQSDPQQGGQGSGQSGDPQEGEPQDGDPSDGDPQQGDPSQQQSKSQSKQDKQKSDKNQQSDQNSDAQDSDSQENDSQDGDDANSQDSNDQDSQNADGQDGQNGDDAYQDELEKGLSDENTDVDDVGEMPDVDEPSENPEEASKEMAQEQDGQDADGDGQDAEGQDAQSADDLAQDIAEAESQDADGDDADGQDADGDPSESNKKSDQAGKQKGRDKIDIPVGGWQHYMANIQRLSGAISHVAAQLQKVKDEQVRYTTQRSKKKSIIPEAGEFDRLNMDAHRDLIVKKKSGQKIEESDLERFHLDERSSESAPIHLILLVDGSASMTPSSNAPNELSPIDVAITTAAILYEASRRVGGIHVYAGLWGADDVKWFLLPGDNRQTAGDGFHGARKGLSSGTSLAPAMVDMAKSFSESKNGSAEMSGFTHVLVISDGDIGDKDKSITTINTLLKNSPSTTVDFAVISDKDNKTDLEKTADGVKSSRPIQSVSVVKEKDFEQMPLAMVKLLFKKVRQSGGIIAQATKNKKSAMKRAYNRMRQQL